MKKRVWGVLLILLMICLACSEVKEYINIVKDENISKEYFSALNKWTRDKTEYSQFETRAHIVATYKTSEFSEAYLAEYSRIYLLMDSEKKTKQELHVDLASDFEEFLFYAYIPEKDSNDFSKAGSIWKIFLADKKGSRVYPIEVRKIEKITPVIVEFFPYINQHHGMFYSLKFSPFPSSFETGQLKLVFTSVLGRVELEWARASDDEVTPSS